MSGIRLYMLQTGTLECRLCNIKMNAGLEAYEIPVPWYLIIHPEGNVVIDGGCAVECATDPDGHWGEITSVYRPVMQPEQGCVAALKALGIEPEEVRYVLQSHLHLDHTGATGRFPNATHIVRRREYEYALAPDWFASGGYIRADFDRPGLKWQLLEESEDGYDVFGDGTIRFIYTSGHATGHSSFLIDLPNSGPILLAVDAAYTLDHWNEKALPGFLASAVEAARSVRKLHALVDKTGAQLVTGHDPEAWPGFRKSPEFYD